ncbi:Eisosome component PIL1-domain-containing protein [Aspergillus coremiiformis]|uniref:Eisosome component PIL1-domain-containing protein n=1 Tax=Aspergillus coremiiformis TaxID=138285 RepID=A0A5N6Z9T1_9EURO|nr:Eisosome component PIL1-domain-containing protein [Aspergillus coremiiformis]
MQQPELSKRMNRLIKNENAAIGAYEKAGRERVSIAKELSDWGEATEDEAVSDITDKLGVLLAEMGDQEELFATYLEEYRTVLKHIRETESSVHPSRNHRARIQDDIAKQKIKDPESIKLETLEQELVRAEAQSLVAEAQLTNMTRARLKEAFDIHLAAVIERGEKQVLLARHARRLLSILDDTPMVPGEPRPEYDRGDEATRIISDAERDLRSWESTTVPIPTAAGHMRDSTLLPAPAARAARDSKALATGESEVDGPVARDFNRDIHESATDARYTDGYLPRVQDIDAYGSRAQSTIVYVPGTQERVVPDAEAPGLPEPAAEPARSPYKGPIDTISYIPGTKQRIDPLTGAELGESSADGAKGVYGGALDVTGHPSGVSHTMDTILGTKEQIEPVSADEGFDESVTDTAREVNGHPQGDTKADESITDPTRHFDEPSTELNEGAKATQVTDDVNGSILAEVKSAREKLQEQPQAVLGIPRTVAVPY